MEWGAGGREGAGGAWGGGGSVGAGRTISMLDGHKIELIAGMFAWRFAKITPLGDENYGRAK